MPKKPIPKKKSVTTKAPKKVSKPRTKKPQKPAGRVTLVIARARKKLNALLARRSHRSFRRTLRRDYVRQLKLPGYWAFTNYVRKVLWGNKRLFLGVVFFYALLEVSFAHFASQDTYNQLSALLNDTGGDVLTGEWGAVGQASILLVSGMMGEFGTIGLTDDQKTLVTVFSTIVSLLAWLTTVWLLRALLAGQKPRLRQGFYNSGAPIVPTILVFLVMAIQLLPLAIGALIINSAALSGLLDGGVESMVLVVGGILLAVLSLYWVTSTILGLVVVTLPGMYPLRAIKTAGDLVIGRRLRILLRLLWLALLSFVIWAVIMIPVILLDAWMKGVWPSIAWLPTVPVALLVVSSFTIVWSASYIYLLYRKVVEDDTSPA